MTQQKTTNTQSDGEQKPAGPSISLPKGGGAIRGMGEKFAANPVTGTGSMSVPITTSPGRSGFGPELSLSYDSGAGNGPFGFGWSLPIPSITRKTDKGLPQYNDAAESDVYILSGAEDLVPVLNDDGTRWSQMGSIDGITYHIHRYRPRIEGLFARIERWTNITTGIIHWRSISSDNITTLYGKDNNSRIFDPADPDPAHPQRIFSWLICQSYDDKGNAVVYEYQAEDSQRIFEDEQGQTIALAHERNRTEAGRSANRYVKRIHYGNRTPNRDPATWEAFDPAQLPDDNWMFEVLFDYGEGHYSQGAPDGEGRVFVQARSTLPADSHWPARPDPFSTYRSGFEVRTYRICRRVLMFHHFPGEAGVGSNCLVRSTDFTYSHTQNPTNVRNPVYTFLQQVTQSGYKRLDNGYLKRSLPPLEFAYTLPVVQDTVEDVDTVSLENLPIGLDGATYQWTDLHGEGIPGILTEQGGAWFYKRNLSPINGRRDNKTIVSAAFAPLEKVATKPNLDLAGGAQFMDLAGDGQPDLVVLDSPLPGLYEHDGDEGWQPFRPFTDRLNRDTGDPNLKFVDLDGDGHADVLISEDDAFVWHPSLAEAGFGPARRVVQALDEEHGPRLVFADGTQSIYLADMSGDGLTDIVRVRNGEVCYWPNLGYARFGAKVTMDHAPLFDNPDQFDQKRIRTADIDGSGTTDIIYLHRDGVRLYFNQSGNSWSEPQTLNLFPRVDDLASIMPTDLLGTGTACLVWSSSLPGNAQRQMRYVNLMGDQKPHLLVRTVNNLGAETHVQYAPSTRFYLQDRYAGKPWFTRLPFPVHVVAGVETYDHVSRNRFVSRYAYHHGYFDGEEREFRGFGMVEQWDTEEMEALSAGSAFFLGDYSDAASHVPPVHTKSWFHTGIYLDREHISRQFEDEYYREPGLNDQEFQELLLPDTTLPEHLAPEEEREACRALKGMLLRQEVYADDLKPDASEEKLQRARTPYTVVEQDFTIRRLQPRAGNRHAVFFTHPREAITCHYERNPADPRIQHAMTLEVDDFGNVLKEAAIGYGRRVTIRAVDVQGQTQQVLNPGLTGLATSDQKKQTDILVTYSENSVTNAVEDADAYRTPLPCEAQTFELTGYAPTGPAGRFQPADFVEDDPNRPGRLRHKMTDEVPYEADVTANPCRRLIERMRTHYRPDDCGASQNDPLALLPLCELQSLALAGESYQLTFTPGLLSQVFMRNAQPLLPDHAAVLGGAGSDRGGYVDIDSNGNCWLPSGRVFLSQDTAHSAADELSYARGHFFLPHRYRDPFHTDAVRTESFVTYDVYNLLMLETRDALGNSVTVGEREHTLPDGTVLPARPGSDYRVLQPWCMMDPNRNRSQVAFDALGMVVGTAVMGKPEETLGDSLNGFVADLSEADTLAHLSDPLANPHAILGRATSRLVYDLFAYQRTKAEAHPQSAVVYTLARETHDADLEPNAQTKVQHSFSYSDGFGREIQQKIQAEPGPIVEGGPHVTPRWVGSGWTIFNNKGNPVRQYEPFFSATYVFEFGVQVGVSPILFYDPLNRVVATLHPNHNYEKVVFDPWRKTTWDVNDTVLNDPAADSDVSGFVHRLPGTEYRPSWYALRTDPAYAPEANWRWPDERIRTAERNAAQRAALHANTPTTAHFDTLGRPFLTLADNGPDPDQPGQHRLYATHVELDIEGNQRAVIDAKDRIVMRYDYDMLGNPIHQASMEAGERWMLNDVSGNPIRAWDSRGHSFRTNYDPLGRPLRSFVTGANPAHPAQELLTERLVYGEQHPEAEAGNLRGALFLHLDQAGVVTNEAQDFKGNPLRTLRRLARQYKHATDWRMVDAVVSANAADTLNLASWGSAVSTYLETETYISRTTFDALNRPIALHSPDNSIIRPGYNEANLLEKVDVNLRGATDTGQPDGQPVWTPFVANIDYDAKGQRTLIEYGSKDTGSNSHKIETTYSYDPETFRLVRLRTIRPHFPAAEQLLQDLSYSYDPAGNITHIHDDAQQPMFFNGTVVEPHNDYFYDAIYRLIQAKGREHIGQVVQPQSSWDDAFRVRLAHPHDGQAMRPYTERYGYDPVGNILTMSHQASSFGIHADGSWTRSYAYDEESLVEPGKQSNRLSTTTVGSGPPESYTHDAHGNMTRMPHLPLMRWDYRDQLQATAQQVVSNGGTPEITYYVYDAAGQRVRKVTERQAHAGQTPVRKEERLYLGGFEIYCKYENDGETVELERETLHIMDNKQRIALVETRTAGTDGAPAQLTRYQLGNHLGSASLELDEQAQIISYEEYAPYGSTTYQAVRSQTETPKRYRYTGKERDEESGLYYHGARYYAPWLEKWINCDPLGLVDTTCLYLIVRSNPVRFVDSNGYFATETPVAPVPDIHIDPVTDPDLIELPSRGSDLSNPGARKPGPLGRLATAILYELAKEAVPRFIDDLRRGHDRQEEGSGAFGNPTMRQPSFDEVVALGRLQSGTYHRDIGLPAEGEGIGIQSRQGISGNPQGPKEGVITYRINLREVDEDINDISEIMRQVQLQLYGFNDLLETEGGVDGIKVRILDYETDPAYRDRMQKAKSDYLRILESTNPLPDNLKNRGYARLHNPDVAVGGYPDVVTAIGDARINSMLGSKYASIQDQILAMDSDVGWFRARIEFTNEKNEVAVFDVFDRGSRSWF